MKQIIYRDWLFACDVTSTHEFYAKLTGGDTDLCGCYACQNFKALREKIYPQEVLGFFEQVGIDNRREVHIAHWGRLEANLHAYSGDFYFCGSILSGQDGFQPMGSGGIIQTVEIIEPFYMGFTNSVITADKIFHPHQVHIAFTVRLPWVIDAPEPNYGL